MWEQKYENERHAQGFENRCPEMHCYGPFLSWPHQKGYIRLQYYLRLFIYQLGDDAEYLSQYVQMNYQHPSQLQWR